MNRVKGLAVAIGISAIALFAVACSNGEAATVGETQQPQPASPAVTAPSTQTILPVGAPVAPAKSGPVAAAQAVSSVASSPSLSGAPMLQTTSGNSGIWVSGQGSVTLEPDLAMLNLGVETTDKTVATARAEAATAMAAMVTSLKGNGVAEIDIQTQFFNISPQYQWTEVFENGIPTNKQVLTGYRVTNTAAVKIRDMENVGPIMDDVAAAGGDATRINGISFTVEDTSPLMVSLREEAVNDAIAKANQFAALTGVGRGSLVFISESTGGAPQVKAFPEADFAMAASSFAPSTSISGGELEITMSVQAVFAIQ
ncbi:MAG: SIMPL domain-containing protein [SAR202 cluster bacterium]|jgi:hypothetical protein|nr:SIMPL domain-containing protein [SAR202 cluster bacterium]MDP6713832.1 SIMPL domain-containing protein [SAR202 cluster bacterium]